MDCFVVFDLCSLFFLKINDKLWIPKKTWAGMKTNQSPKGIDPEKWADFPLSTRYV